MTYYDISIPVHEGMPVYGGDPPVEVRLCSSIENGDMANVSNLAMGAHTGTHIDAPRHFLNDGKTVDEIPIDILIGKARVLEILDGREICRDSLASHGLEGEERVLLKTSNSRLWQKDGFHEDFVYMSHDAARYLVEIGIKVVGIDYLSVERYGANEPLTHTTLLAAGIVIIEGLNLLQVEPGIYELFCLPLLLKGCDGSPCRAVLLER